ncbi:tRNA (adenosine(37)-N6)-threonylcarbamoyltransferase complex ATPase subunit type 1 TsaE [Winogradskyella echinorum]|uniref:tRNA threonylcarbamoyladenosine biosynthesis protein TsaE n=1 Tax=Winogradskyella echinorum TaxID=538189 RepID=A0ABR6Y0H5_9FLAO|nr:tRNA (adenosine(37)-N6)-threonylcarbamoyltransferase complex ATPase subunit type 1 TsaE [Winogradskyella echinorum]MBC3846236.1 tRNA (adenosine(37)-N6)-threonylcarbamoyltransferase complex ATPase subunit type 1 TsaE [Winogradskyella echinorum]MBC5750584.1 tRNA (adenosine(37)-N6)-threonylcarbamoyltransferase complex ATPase subunit type 1 TsaE [Winogradskyella echinorum]
MKTIELTYHIKDIDAIAASVLEHLESKTILFNGGMGAGKTTFINALLKAMHSTDVATSPTFSIVNEYTIPNDKVYHFDFYRIESVDEAYNFGIEDYLSSEHWLFMEWPERIEALLPEDTQTITITDLQDNKRSLKLTINTKHLTENTAMTTENF